MHDWESDIASGVAARMRQVEQRAVWAEDPAAWAHDVLGVHLWSKQREIARSVVENKRTVVASCHGTGKALDVGTLIPTPGGFVKMGDLQPGDTVLGSRGQPVRVVATSGVFWADRYVLTFSTPGGVEKITASGDHKWNVLDAQARAGIQVLAERKNTTVTDWSLWGHRTRTYTTAQLAKFLAVQSGAAGGDFVVPAEDAWTPAVQPRGPVLANMTELMAQRGCVDPQGRPGLAWLTERDAGEPFEISGLREKLKTLKVATIAAARKDGGSKIWMLSLLCDPRSVPPLPVRDDDALVRTVARTAAAHSKTTGGWDGGHRLLKVEKIEPGDVQCVQVDAADSLYLAGRRRIPTHNSMIASVLACWWVATKPIGDAIIVSTAPTYAQVNKILWEEIRKHHATAQQRGFPLPGRVTQSDEWKDPTGRILGFGRKPMSGDRHGFHGIHRKFVLALGDEACGLPEEIWTGIEAITTNEGCRQLYIGNPDDRATEFGRAFLKPEIADQWHRITVAAHMTPNFTGEDVPDLLRQVLVAKQWCEERRRDWGEKDARYISKVMAQFPDVSKSSLIAPHVIVGAFEDPPPQQSRGVVRLGVDVARFGPDSTTVVSMAGVTARIEDSWGGTDTVSSAHRVLKIAEEVKERLDAAWVEIRVDAVGLGAGVVDTLNARAVLLKEPWFSVFEMHGSAAPPTDLGGSVHGYGNARAYWFDQLRQGMANGSIRIEEHEQLKDDLAIVYYLMRNGRMYIVSKEEMRSKHGRSPDYADALCYACAPVFDGAPIGSTISEDVHDIANAYEDGDDLRELTIAPF